MSANENRLPYFLLFLRLFPCSPNWAINMCSGVLGVPGMLTQHFFGSALDLAGGRCNVQCFFSGFFRLFRRLTRRNSELDEDFGWVRQKIIWVRTKIWWVRLGFLSKIPLKAGLLHKNSEVLKVERLETPFFYYFSQNSCSKSPKFWVRQKHLLS